MITRWNSLDILHKARNIGIRNTNSKLKKRTIVQQRGRAISLDLHVNYFVFTVYSILYIILRMLANTDSDLAHGNASYCLRDVTSISRPGLRNLRHLMRAHLDADRDYPESYPLPVCQARPVLCSSRGDAHHDGSDKLQDNEFGVIIDRIKTQDKDFHEEE